MTFIHVKDEEGKGRIVNVKALVSKQCIEILYKMPTKENPNQPAQIRGSFTTGEQLNYTGTAALALWQELQKLEQFSQLALVQSTEQQPEQPSVPETTSQPDQPTTQPAETGGTAKAKTATSGSGSGSNPQSS